MKSQENLLFKNIILFIYTMKFVLNISKDNFMVNCITWIIILNAGKYLVFLIEYLLWIKLNLLNV